MLDKINELIIDILDRKIKYIYLYCDEEDPLYEKIINRLVEQNDEGINLWLDNNIFIHLDYEIEKSSLSFEAKKIVSFVLERAIDYENKILLKDRKGTNHLFYNINDKIDGKNFTLINTSEYRESVNYDIVDEYIEEIKKANDFETYVSKEKTTNIKLALYLNLYLPYSFMLVDKVSNKAMGTISIRHINGEFSKILSVSEISYYIYNEYRGKGYATEAVNLLVEKYFEKKLRGYYPTKRLYELEIKNNNISCIKIECNIKNEASKRVAEKSGFVLEGINHYHHFMYEEPQHYLSFFMNEEMYLKLKK